MGERARGVGARRVAGGGWGQYHALSRRREDRLDAAIAGRRTRRLDRLDAAIAGRRTRRLDRGGDRGSAGGVDGRVPGTRRTRARSAPGEIAAIREAGLTRIEVTGIRSPHGFDFTDRGQLSEVKAACRNEGVSVVSVHGPSRGYASEDEDERRQAVGDAVNAAQVAEELGGGVMVCHFGTDERAEQSVTDVLEQTDDSTLRLAVENGKDLRDFADIVDRVGSDRFGMIVDIGHTRDADGVNPFTKPEAARRDDGPVRRQADSPPPPRLQGERTTWRRWTAT